VDELTASYNQITLKIKALEKKLNSTKNILLVAVSKKQPVELMNSYQSIVSQHGGIAIFGENYLRELKEKIPSLKTPFKAHFIGKLQSNKIKEIVKYFDVIESVDSIGALEKINKEAESLGLVKEVFFQVNVSDDPKKGGFGISDLKSAIDKTETVPFVKLSGLMTITEFYENPEDARKDFATLKKCREDNFSDDSEVHLSMGMSQDFDIAIEEGATIVRIGTALFGERRN